MKNLIEKTVVSLNKSLNSDYHKNMRKFKKSIFIYINKEFKYLIL